MHWAYVVQHVVIVQDNAAKCHKEVKAPHHLLEKGGRSEELYKRKKRFLFFLHLLENMLNCKDTPTKLVTEACVQIHKVYKGMHTNSQIPTL